MEEALIRSRSAAARVGRLATIAADGQRPHIVPCCFAIAAEQIFTAIDDIKAKSTLDLRRAQNIRAHSEVSLLIDHYAEDWSALWWIRMDGRAHVLDLESPELGSAHQLLAAKYEQYRRRPPPGSVISVGIHTWRAWP